MPSLPSIDLDVAERLKTDDEFRQRFFLAESSAMVARQLIALRKRRGMSQEQVAEKLGTGQPAISRVESADYQKWSFRMLQRLAGEMGARLRVIIEPFEDIIQEYEQPEVVGKSADALKAPLSADQDMQGAILELAKVPEGQRLGHSVLPPNPDNAMASASKHPIFQKRGGAADWRQKTGRVEQTRTVQ